MESEKIEISMRNSTFVLDKSRLLKFPDSRISKAVSDGFKTLSYDRKPQMFRDMIMDIYTDDEVHIPLNICVGSAVEELQFWGFDESVMSPCCVEKVKMEKEMIQAADTMKTPWETRVKLDRNMTTKDKLYQLLEYPQSSKGALAWYCVLMVLVIISIICLAVTTLPQFQSYRIVGTTNSYSETIDDQDELNNTKIGCLVIEWLVFIVLIVDYIVRVVTAPVKTKFCLNLANLIDLVVLIPFVGIVFLTTLSIILAILRVAIPGAYFVGLVLSYINSLRVLYILKLMGKFQRPRILLYTLKTSFVEILLMFVLVTAAISVFSTLVYYSEAGSEYTSFHSIPQTAWWAIVTLTTVGYGDYLPHSTLGKLVGSCCAMTGIVLIALLVSIIVKNYTKLATAVQRVQNGRPLSRPPISTQVMHGGAEGVESGFLRSESKI